MCGLGRIYLVSGHCQQINVALFQGAAILELEGKLLWIQKLRFHVADNSSGGSGGGMKVISAHRFCTQSR